MRISFRKNQDGSALLLGALTMWFILYSIVLIIEVSDAVSEKMKLQIAADTAALSGARVMANSISTISWINDARAMLYYEQCRYAADLVTMGAMAKIYLSGAVGSDGEDILEADGGFIDDNDLIDGGNFHTKFKETWERYTEKQNISWMNDPVADLYTDEQKDEASQVVRMKGLNAREQLARIQHSIALVSKTLVEKEIYDRANANGSESTCFFPTIPLVPDDGWKREVTVTKIGDPSMSEYGWEFLYDDGKFISARNIGEDSWDINYNNELRAIIQKINDNRSKVKTCQITQGSESCRQILIDREEKIVITDDVAIRNLYLDDGSQETCREQLSEAPDWDSWNASSPLPDFETNTECTRWRYEGEILFLWNYTTEEWEEQPAPPEPVEGEGSAPQTAMSPYGTAVRITNRSEIDLGNGIQLHHNRLQIHNTAVHLTNPIRMTSWFNGVHLEVRDNYARVNGLSTANANCEWQRRWGGGHHDRRNDRRRHRMCVEVAGQQWKYEIEQLPTYLDQEKDRIRFAINHGQADVKSMGGGGLDVWEDTWFDVENGELTGGDDKLRIGRECWHPEDKFCTVIGVHDRTECNGTGNTVSGGSFVNPCNGKFHNKDTFQDGDNTMNCNLCKAGVVIVEGAHAYTDFSGSQFHGEYTGDRKEIYDLMQMMPTVLNFSKPDGILTEMNPLVLTEEFFKYGLSVGTWSSGGNNLFKNIGSEALLGDGKLFNRSKNGIFAFASARVGFLNPDTGIFQYRFTDADERQAWLDSKDNLYETTWRAHLVPISIQIRTEDIDAEEDDSGLTYLMRFMASTAWRQTFFGRNQHTGSKIDNIDGFNYDDNEIYEVMLH
jgi:hypothetical protein